jgi:hypothetical protein
MQGGAKKTSMSAKKDRQMGAKKDRQVGAGKQISGSKKTRWGYNKAAEVKWQARGWKKAAKNVV